MIRLESGVVYDIVEVAEKLKRRVETVREYLKSGALRGQKVGRKWYVTDRALTEFLTGEPVKREGK